MFSFQPESWTVGDLFVSQKGARSASITCRGEAPKFRFATPENLISSPYGASSFDAGTRLSIDFMLTKDLQDFCETLDSWAKTTLQENSENLFNKKHSQETIEQMYQSVIKSRSIEKDYKEMALTGYVKHNIKDISTSQFFLKEGPLAILPFSKNNFSFVWSVKKGFVTENIASTIKSKICEILKVKNINITNIQSYPLTLNLKRTYYKNDVLILGEGLHTIHPVAGQGFNLVLRDIKKLKEVLKYYTGLGMSIKSSPALEDFSNQRKSENIITGVGIDLTHNFFKQNKLLDPLKDVILKNISKNNTLKKISKFISNQGLSI